MSPLLESHPCSSDTASTLSLNDNPDLEELIKCLPDDIVAFLEDDREKQELVEVVMDVGRQPEIHFTDSFKVLETSRVTPQDLQEVVSNVGEFGGDNRAGIGGTLHRVSCMRNRSDEIVGLTLRVGKAVRGPADFLADMIKEKKSVLFLGFPGVGKTTVIRDVARASGDLGRRVVVVDSSNEIGGGGDVPHPFIGRARRIQVPRVDQLFDVMIEAVQNHRPEMIVVDEVGRRQETDACRSIAERGVQIIATAHGRILENLMNNPEIVGLLGGIGSVVVGDKAASDRSKGDGMARKSTLERQRPPVFEVVVEIRDRDEWVIHNVKASVDNLLRGLDTEVEVRKRHQSTGEVSVTKKNYSPGGSLETPSKARKPPAAPALPESTGQGKPEVTIVSKKQQSKIPSAVSQVARIKSLGIAVPARDLVMKRLKKKGLEVGKRNIKLLFDGMLLVASEGMQSLLKSPEILQTQRVNALKGEWTTFLPHLEIWVEDTFLAEGLYIDEKTMTKATLLLASKMSTALGQAISNI
ncbi:hypothetical protein BSKO_02061 [Bryopsis sp. KO-2023]|nr:hypothetical protein BSKO_02061 [Bryopsis sp. KO-2023]